MKERIKRGLTGILCFIMLFTTVKPVFAQPTSGENQNNNTEYDILYQSVSEDEQGFMAQFTLKNNTDKVMTGWTLDFDYNMPIEKSNDYKLSVVKNNSNQQHKFHYQMEGLGNNKTIAPNNKVVIPYRVNQKLNVNDTPQNYKLTYKLQPENPLLPSETEAYSRQEWIADLMEAVSFSYVSSEITSSYVDVSLDSPYLNAIEMALNNKTITKEETGTVTQNGVEVTGPVFYPTSATNRDFAIVTALRALRYESIHTPGERFNLAVKIGLLDEANNGKAFTTQEAKAMLEIIKEKSKMPEYGEGVEGSTDIKDSVIQISEEELGNKDYVFADNEIAKDDNKGKLTLPNVEKTRKLKAGDVFTLPKNSIYSSGVAQKVEKIDEVQSDKIIITTTAPDLNEFLGEEGLTVKGSHQSTYADFTPSEDFNVIYDGVTPPNGTVGKNAKFDPVDKLGDLNIDDDKISLSIKDEYGIEGTIDINFPKVDLDVDIDSGFLGMGSQINKFYAAIDNNFSANLKLSKGWEKEWYIGTVKIPVSAYGVGCKVDIYVNASVDGEVSVSYVYNSKNGFDYSEDNGFQSFAQNTSELTIDPYKVETRAGVNPALLLSFFEWDIADFGVEAGVAGQASETVREDGHCYDATAHVYLSLEALTEHSILGEFLDEDLTMDIWDKDSSPVRLSAHYEHTSSHDGKVPECSYGKGSLKLQVKDYTNDNPLNAHLSAIKTGGSGNETIEIDALNGSVSKADISNGSYDYTIQSNGYITYTGKFKISNNSESNLGVIKLIKSGNGNISGNITDALTGSGIKDVQLTLLDGHDIDESSEQFADKVEFTGDTVSDTSGHYNIDASNGYYTLKMEKKGYVTAYTNITMVSNGDTVNVTLVPDGSDISGTNIGDLRIVLTWGSLPYDLDSHLCGPTANGVRRFHTYYSNKNYSENGKLHAFLDRDDVISYGPETSTVYDINTSGKYSFYVHNYSSRNSTSDSSLSLSGARVNVYTKEETGETDSNGDKIYRAKLIGSYKVPVNEEGTVWHVFDYNAGSGKITPRNVMTYLSNPGDVGSYMIKNNNLNDEQLADINAIKESIVEK